MGSCVTVGDLAHIHACQLLLRDGGMPNEGRTERELNRARATGYTGKKQPSLGWKKDVLPTSSKSRGDEPLTWE